MGDQSGFSIVDSNQLNWHVSKVGDCLTLGNKWRIGPNTRIYGVTMEPLELVFLLIDPNSQEPMFG